MTTSMFLILLTTWYAFGIIGTYKMQRKMDDYLKLEYAMSHRKTVEMLSAKFHKIDLEKHRRAFKVGNVIGFMISSLYGVIILTRSTDTQLVRKECDSQMKKLNINKIIKEK